MCDSIHLKNGTDIGTIRQFQSHFNVNPEEIGFDGNDDFLDCCMCSMDLEKFLKDKPFIYECGEWYEV